MRRDPSLDTLLDLNGQVIGGLARGHWVKFEASRVAATPERPHGIRYSLTLHNASGQRVFGIDNAHAIVIKHGVRMIRPQAFDHLHQSGRDKGSEYRYRNAAALLEDFWRGVDKILKDP